MAVADGDDDRTTYQRERDYNLACQNGTGSCPDYLSTAAFVTGGLAVTAFAAGLVASVVPEAAVVGPTYTTATAACADGDCLNEVNTGTNVVYQLVENGTTRYIGITGNFEQRAAQHLSSKGWAIEPLPGLENLSRYDARAVEQILIESYGLENLYNQINSIATSNPVYSQAIQRGTDILRSIGFFR